MRIPIEGSNGSEYYGDPAQFTSVVVNGDGSRTVTVNPVTVGGTTVTPHSYSIGSDANPHIPITGGSYTVPAGQWGSGTNRIYAN